MAQPHNPLLHPPFFIVQGINPNSPISAQTEQIDQLNTLLLQEIDANFAKIHQVITSRILPEIKRFAIAGEPTREAAKFWRSFFEAAAAVRVTTAGETTESNAEHSQTNYDDQTLTIRRDDEQSFSQAHSDGSFMFDPPATSSTPLAKNANGQSGGAAVRCDDSFEDSMESPFDRMDRKLRDGLRIGQDDYGLGMGVGSDGTSDMPTPSLPSGYDLPDLQAGSTFDSNRTGMGMGDVSTGTVERPSSSSTPRAGYSNGNGSKGKAKDTSRNPFDTKWNGITDLRTTPLNAKFAKFDPKAHANANSKPAAPVFNPAAFDDDDDDDNIQLNMSPPVTMHFSLPPRAQAMVSAAKTPKKEVPVIPVNAVLDDLMEEITGGYVPSPRLPTPEGLGRYSVLPGQLPLQPRENADDQGRYEHEAYSLALGHVGSPLARKSMANTSFGSDDALGVGAPSAGSNVVYEDDDSFDDDSFDSDGVPMPMPVGSEGAGSGAMEVGEDDSYMTNTPGPSHRNYQGDFSTTALGLQSGGGDRDVGDTSEAGQIFGGPRPGARENYIPGYGGSGNGGGGGGGNGQVGGVGEPPRFSIMQLDEMMTFHGGRLEDAAGREVEESPLIKLGGRR